MQPQVSVIIPVYNVERLLPRCLDSVVAQTLRDIEIICVDDGSPDRSADILKRYAAQDGRIRVILQENRGQGSARNRGFDIATGEFILYVDSDDWIDADYCEKLYAAAVEAGADVACCSIRKIRPSHERWTVRYDRMETFSEVQEKFRVCNCPPDFHIVNKLISRKMLSDLGLRFREHVCYEDVEYLMRVLGEGGKLVTVPGTAYRYVFNGSSTTKSAQTPKKQSDKYQAHKAFVAYADAHAIRVGRRYRSITRRFWALGTLTLLKIKERDGWETWRLFDCIPVFFKRRNDGN